jgi:hypothetical protein
MVYLSSYSGRFNQQRSLLARFLGYKYFSVDPEGTDLSLAVSLVVCVVCGSNVI